MKTLVLINENDDTQGRVMSCDDNLTNLVYRTVDMPLDDAVEQAKGFLLARGHDGEKATLTTQGQTGYDIAI